MNLDRLQQIRASFFFASIIDPLNASQM